MTSGRGGIQIIVNLSKNCTGTSLTPNLIPLDTQISELSQFHYFN